ncbi:MAG: response regulator [Prolixibacteraceae bacterium]
MGMLKTRFSAFRMLFNPGKRHRLVLDKIPEQTEKLKKQDGELGNERDENNQIKESLIREKALLDSMLNTLPDYIYFKNRDSEFLRVSKSFAERFGMQTEEIIGKTDFDLRSPEKAQKYREEEQRIMRSGRGLIDEIRKGVNTGGNELWTSVTKLPLYDETGECIGTFGITKNVTALKKLEIAVKDQNDQLLAKKEELEKTIAELHHIQSELKWEKSLMDALMDNLPDAVYFKDPGSKFMKVSKSMARLFNLERPEELHGKSDFDFFTREHALPAYNAEQTIIKTRKPIIGLVEKDTFKDGGERYVSTTKMPLTNEKGEIAGTFGISRDITRIKQMELEIREHNERLKAQQEELKATNEELKAQEEELRVANEELQSQEEELRVANEELAEQTKILSENEKVLKAQQERLVEINEELRLASQYKSEFLANMSHELRTPLNSMLILSKLLENNKKGNLTGEQLKSVSIIHKSGKDLLDLINEILDLSKIEAGKMTCNFSDTLTTEIRMEIIQNFGPVASSKGLSLKVNQDDDFPQVIFTDKQRLMQIIRNLLSNAFKFTSTGGVKVNLGVTPSATKLVNPDLDRGRTCFIAVEDSGIGIPAGKVDEIFEAFQQADGSISRKYGGTGLGLSISKQLTRALGGEIHVESIEGRGSVFTVYLPMDGKASGAGIGEEKTTPEQVQKLQQGRTRESDRSESEYIQEDFPVFINDDRQAKDHHLLVLIIHGEKEKARELLELCHTRRFNVLAASCIRDGIRLAERFAPQAIIISSELYHSSGLKSLKENKITCQLPLHLVSRIENLELDNIEELKTPESVDFGKISQHIENRISKESNQVLLVEDDPSTREAIQMLFGNKDVILHEAKTGQQAYEMISAGSFDCVILDLGLPDFSGNKLLEKLKSDHIPIPNVIIHTARELSAKELRELHEFSDSIVIKGVKSDERLMDEVTLFLHQVAHKLPKESRAQGREETEEKRFRGKKVLVVDDDIRNVFALAQILEEREIEVLEAENGQVAIDVLKSNPDIDLILMDIMMPVMDGYVAMKTIRNTAGINNIPIITLSAKAMKEDYQKAIASGANDYISKPVDVRKFLTLLKIWLFR